MAKKFVHILMHRTVLVGALQESNNPMLWNSGGTIIHLNKHKIMKQWSCWIRVDWNEIHASTYHRFPEPTFIHTRYVALP